MSSCRFIPNRNGMDLDISNYNLTKENNEPNVVDTEEYKNTLEEAFDIKASKVLAFKNKAPVPKEHNNQHSVLYSSSSKVSATKKSVRYISQNPEKLLDGPGMVNDYYLNLLDWSSKNLMGVALGDTVYTWSPTSGQIVPVHKDEGRNITSVSFSQGGECLAIGTEEGNAILYHLEAQRVVRTLKGHSNRVASLAWNESILTTGSSDTKIHNHDVRVGNHLTSVLSGHSQDVCGLKWSDDGLQLASGGNDNVVNIWDVNRTEAKFTFTDHTSGVKALAWAPFQKDLLATGGGTADRTIRFWNTTSGQCVNTIDTGSQVSCLQWSKNPACKEIVSGHGFAHNQLSVWKYPSLAKIADLKGHTSRILHMTQSPDGTIVSAAADETIRFWKIFDTDSSSTKPTVAVKSAVSKSSSIGGKIIR